MLGRSYKTLIKSTERYQDIYCKRKVATFTSFSEKSLFAVTFKAISLWRTCSSVFAGRRKTEVRLYSSKKKKLEKRMGNE